MNKETNKKALLEKKKELEGMSEYFDSLMAQLGIIVADDYDDSLSNIKKATRIAEMVDHTRILAGINAHAFICGMLSNLISKEIGKLINNDAVEVFTKLIQERENERSTTKHR